ncbi:MAG TPA: type II toxin-antitoxin system prevent-host-death family antitoxin [Actinomycetota bacterium]|nr:type II toxin-antitoxin system prevent-host-death family antitoxin [Actinomycetota bacterium]
MREIGVRELKQVLSKTLREVAAGEPVRVTLRGRALADIVPPESRKQESQIDQLINQRRVAAPTKARPRRPPHMTVASRAASELVLAERDAEYVDAKR